MLQNRVTPSGEIIATSARGTFMGNRGILHDESRRIVRTSRNAMWIICLLEFKDRRRVVMTPNRYTELFFLDEAVALSAGHRPCAECRRQSYRTYLDAVNVESDYLVGGAKDLDRQLNASRRAPRPVAVIATLPNGVFVDVGHGDFRLVWAGSLHRWTPDGYVEPIALAALEVTEATVVTPSLSVAALRHGYPVAVHPSSQ